ncbi:MAG: FG-GAP repeat protein [Anaerolineae bacterium]|nr:FG-GAP repeat protein [Anaerolineae bacterium]
MKKHLFVHILALTLLLLPTGGSLQARALPQPLAAAPDAQFVESDPPEALAVLPGGDAGWWSAAQEEIRQSEYQITWQDQTYLADVSAAYQAPNRAQNLRAYFTPEGVRVIPRVFEGDTPPWEWGLSLSSYSYAGDPVNAGQIAAAAPRLTANANRMEYHHLPSAIVEWYVNDARGLEHGFTLSAPPQGTAAGEIALDMALTGALTPHLGGEDAACEFTTPGGVTVLRYGELHVADADGRQLPARLELPAARTVRIAIEAAGARYPLTVDPLATTPAWSAESNQADAEFGRSVATAGDVNGDGYSDVIVGASMYDNGQSDEGRAFVYYGSAMGLETIAYWTAESDQAGAQFGTSVATAGDVNGDGYSDIIVGAHSYDNGETNEGRAYIYYGSAGGVSPAADWIIESNQAEALFGCSVATAGDMNGDGYSDVIIGAYKYDNNQTDEGRAFIYYGSPSGLTTALSWTIENDQDGAYLGFAVATAGDVNGDGYSDIIVGAYLFDNGETNEGCVYVYHGSRVGVPRNPSWVGEANQIETRFGYSVATAGDVNGDGYSDVIVGAYRYDNGETDEGRAFVYHGSATGLSADPAWTVESNQAGAYLGVSVAAAGDVNGDGYGDVIVGVYQYDNGEADEGQARVYLGADAGLSLAPDWVSEGDQAEALFGYSVATAGDVNGDGYSDLIVGALKYDNVETDEGRAFVYHGAASGLAEAPVWTVEGDQDDAWFGESVATAGDVNGDGYSDVIVGAYSYDNGEMNEGRAFVYLGSAAGLAANPIWTAEGDQAGAWFGWSVDTAGDVNGDGYSDIIIGASEYNNVQKDAGRVFVYHGSASGLGATPAWTAENDQTASFFGGSVASAGDINGDGYGDVIVGASGYDNGETDEGRAYVYFGSASGLNAAPGWTAESNQAVGMFGNSVATAGDVNGDGHSDIIIGAQGYDNQAYDNRGRAYVYHGSALGLPATPAWAITGDQSEARFGYSVATAGDVNGDGYSDILVGAYKYDNGQTDEGRAFAYYGSATGLANAYAWSAESNIENAGLGDSVATAGDVDGDGYSDIIIGADSHYGSTGRVYVFHGSGSGLGPEAVWTVYGQDISGDSGMAGDVNGDGYGDVIVGASSYNDNGRAYVYYGNNGDGLHMLPRQLRADGSTPIAHLGMSDSGEAFQLRMVGRMPLGRDEVRLAWQVAPMGMSFGSTAMISGVSDWTDVLTTGVEINQTINGLTEGTRYHWRVRLLYRPGNALGQAAGRWIYTPQNGWNETDLRTKWQSSGAHDIYMPLVLHRYPPVPYAPTLNAIVNDDGDGNYTVSWNAADPDLATSYQLQEATSADFSNATTAYEGAALSANIAGRGAGTYHYRVRGRNDFGYGAWSNVYSAQVVPPNLFLAVADATVKQGAAGTAFGADVLMGAGYDHCDADQVNRGLVSFNLAPVLAGAPITKAVLRLHLTKSCDSSARSHTVTTYRVGGAWDEGTLTWNSQPAAAEAYGSATMISRDAWGWYEFDVTALVQAWVNGQYANYGIMLRSNEGSGNDTALLEFDTREATNLPHLQITYAGMARTADAANSALPAVKAPLTVVQELQPAPLCADCAPFAIATAK